jgi:hypothetical protein
MKAYYIIDNEGYYVEPVFLIKQEGVDYSNYIEVEPPIELIRPRWNGNEWVEGKNIII